MFDYTSNNKFMVKKRKTIDNKLKRRNVILSNYHYRRNQIQILEY